MPQIASREKFFFCPRFIREIWIALLPLMKPTTYATEYFGVIDVSSEYGPGEDAFPAW